MPSPAQITVAQLSRLIALPGAPALVDVRSDEEFKADPRFVPAAQRQSSLNVERWSSRYAGQSIVVLCQTGKASSQAVAARLRHEGLDAQTLEAAMRPGAKAASCCCAPQRYLSATTRDAPSG